MNFLICGCPRSGTSMVAKMCKIMGAPIDGNDSRSPNRGGYLEDFRLREVTDRLLEQLETDRYRADVVVDDLWDETLASNLPDEAAWKDPAASITLPFWKRAFPDLKVVVCLREPIAVANSFHHVRPGADPLEMWRAHNESVLENTDPDQRIVVNFDRVFEDPAREAKRLAEFLDLDIEKVEDAAAWVNPAVSHTTERGCPEHLRELYEQLKEEAE